MKQYQCTKKVIAFKIAHIIHNRLVPEDFNIPEVEISEAYEKKHNPTVGGYYVKYEDGYESFSPAEAFEKGYHEIDPNRLLNFGEAIERVKKGCLVARKGWNGKGMFVFMRPADELDPLFIIEKVKSLPDAYKNTLKNVTFQEGEKIKFPAYLCMKSADNSVVNGWLASQTDMLAQDWCIIGE